MKTCNRWCCEWQWLIREILAFIGVVVAVSICTTLVYHIGFEDGKNSPLKVEVKR